MAFTDWTFSGDGTGALDASVKHAGSSSYKAVLPYSTGHYNNKLTHDTFSEPQLQAVFWARLISSTPSECRIRIRHSSYGSVDLERLSDNTFYKFRVTFWYDAGSNTKWSRVERYIDGAWVQYGSDSNRGAGSPAADSIVLELNKGYYGVTTTAVTCWFDEVEVYA